LPICGSPSALGYPVHPELHADVRTRKFGVRLRDVRRAALLAASDGAGVPDGLVRRVADDGALHRAGHPDSRAVLPEPARQTAARLYVSCGGRDGVSSVLLKWRRA